MSEFVYVLSNSSLPGLLKIGFTSRTVGERIKDLSSSGIPTSFILEFCFEVENGREVETILHDLFKDYRYEKEFFKLELSFLVRRCKEQVLAGYINCISYNGRASKLFLTDVEKAIHEKQKLIDIENKRVEQERKKQQKLLQIEKNNIEILKNKNLIKLESDLFKYLKWLNNFIEKNKKTESLIGIIFFGGNDDKEEGKKIAKGFDADAIAATKVIYKTLNQLLTLGEYERSLKKLLIDSNKHSKSLENIFYFDRRVIVNFQNNSFKFKGWNLIFLGILSELDLAQNFPLFTVNIFDTKYFYKDLKMKRDKVYFKLLEDMSADL